MTSTYQNEIPKARVNITLNVEKNGSQKKVELPFKLLVLGKFTERGDRTNVAFRNRINVSKDNLNDVIKKISPKVSMFIPNHINKKHQNLKVDLTFENYKDFCPENIVMQVDELKRLIAARNLLKELKAHILDNDQLKKQLEEMVKEKEELRIED